MRDNKEQGFYIVWCPTSEKPPRLRHRSYEAAAAEATRSTRLYPNQSFIILKAVCSKLTEANPTRTTFFDYEDGA